MVLYVLGKRPMVKNSETVAVGNKRKYTDKRNGVFPTTSEQMGSGTSGKTDVAKIKPYILSHHEQHFPMDKRRIFGRALSNAQPYEMMDIVLSRQSI
jgi:hypothetical protein